MATAEPKVFGSVAKTDQVLLVYQKEGINKESKATDDIPKKIRLGWQGQSWFLSPGDSIRISREGAEWILLDQKHHWDADSHTKHVVLKIQELGVKEQHGEVSDELKASQARTAELEKQKAELEKQLEEATRPAKKPTTPADSK